MTACGSMRKLIDVASGGHVWAERYDGSMSDVFAVQDKVTGNIIEALKVHLTADEQAAVDLRGTRNAEAYDAYLRGRKLLSERRIIDCRRLQRGQTALQQGHLA